LLKYFFSKEKNIKFTSFSDFSLFEGPIKRVVEEERREFDEEEAADDRRRFTLAECLLRHISAGEYNKFW